MIALGTNSGRHHSLQWLMMCVASSCFITGGHGFISNLSSLRKMKKITTPMVQTPVTTLYYRNSNSTSLEVADLPLDRFHRRASEKKEVDQACILSIDNRKYNLTAWAKAHPGGDKVLQKFHNRDATKAFEAAHHSAQAYAMLKDFLIVENPNDDDKDKKEAEGSKRISSSRPTGGVAVAQLARRVRHKLFTKEDPIGVHKYLGIFCLVNFIGRYRQMLFGKDLAAGLGSQGHPWLSMACLVPHGLLSLTSLIFHTVPRERVVGKPMIWQEYRIHNIIFGLRSVLSALATAYAIRMGNTPLVRKVVVAAAGCLILLSNHAADVATDKLCASNVESTTATMPYWEGCSTMTQRRFKGFYAYCQFMATLACLAVGNPAWPLSVLLAIQLASLLMTLVRKGLLSARGYHYGYTATLIAPWFVGFRCMMHTKTFEFPLVMVLAYALYQLRRKGVNKYALWVPVVVGRFVFGDAIMNYAAW